MDLLLILTIVAVVLLLLVGAFLLIRARQRRGTVKALGAPDASRGQAADRVGER